MEEKRAIIFNIQKFSIHDGPGIRTVVFFKGCPLRCLWCANPESQIGKIQISWDDTKCVECNKCVESCPEGSIINVNGRKQIDTNKCENWETIIKECPTKGFTVEGEYKSVDEIMQEVLKDKVFYEESGGGVTLSGGEVLQQADFAIELLKELKKYGIHRAAETTGYAAPQIFERFIEHIDLLLYDMKHYDPVKHKEATNVDNKITQANMRTAVKKGKKIIARIPVIPGFNDDLKDAKEFCKLLKDIGIKEVNLLPFHQMGEKKYEALGMEYKMKGIKQLHPEDLKEYQEIFLREEFDCKI
ncbi:pyruvate formate lyase activating enzyme [Alkalibaculum bacchi]|uniref:Pyruvate formate lyase activating enzyme n=1 Tax=Alkalibaculum bacchi TaxID=645887 RepID=A0A366IH77_9FIRM|nr:glycyl-radical enzyme activating protein [Alkalibaculum bacchi]RBP70190.1 pyruvate formate lyase activating enzyme [Alkalibaculum bacchi]